MSIVFYINFDNFIEFTALIGNFGILITTSIHIMDQLNPTSYILSETLITLFSYAINSVLTNYFSLFD